jgi:hypothetical protein
MEIRGTMYDCVAFTGRSVPYGKIRNMVKGVGHIALLCTNNLRSKFYDRASYRRTGDVQGVQDNILNDTNELPLVLFMIPNVCFS